MDFDLLLRNRGVARILVGVPADGTQLRARVESASGDVITLEEATLAALARAYLTVTTDPTRKAVELRAATVVGGDGHHLLDSGTAEAAIRSQLVLPGSAAPPPSHGPETLPRGASEAPPKHPFPATASPAALATEHGRPPDDDDLELEIDESADGEESIFGEVPTHHSRPPK